MREGGLQVYLMFILFVLVVQEFIFYYFDFNIFYILKGQGHDIFDHFFGIKRLDQGPI